MLKCIFLRKLIFLFVILFFFLLFENISYSITWCHDYTLSVIGNTDSNRLGSIGLRSELAKQNYNHIFTIPPGSSIPPQKLECGDILVIGVAHSGVIDAHGRFDSYLQPVSGGDTKPIPYPRNQATTLPNYKHDWSLDGVRKYSRNRVDETSEVKKTIFGEWAKVVKKSYTQYPYKNSPIEVWRWDSSNQDGILDKAKKSIEKCKFDIDSIINPIKTLDQNNVELCKNKDLKKDAAKLLKDVKKYKKDQKAALKTTTEVKNNLKICSLSSIKGDLNKILTNDNLEKCSEYKDAQDLLIEFKLKNIQIVSAQASIATARVLLDSCEYKETKSEVQGITTSSDLDKCDVKTTAQGIIDQSKQLEAEKVKVDGAIVTAKRALTNAQRAVDESRSIKQNVISLVKSTRKALSKLNALSGIKSKLSSRCSEAKQKAKELSIAVQNANVATQQIAPYYQETKNAVKDACKLAQLAELADTKKEQEKLGDEATSAAKRAREPSAKANEKAVEAKESFQAARQAQSAIESAGDYIATIKQDIKLIVKSTGRTATTYDVALAGSAGRFATQANEAKNTVANAGECFKDFIPKATKIATVADKKADEENRIITETEQLNIELDGLQKQIVQTESNIDLKSYSCDVKVTADVKDAEAAAETADLFAGLARDNWEDAEKCASRAREPRKEVEPKDEDEPSSWVVWIHDTLTTCCASNCDGGSKIVAVASKPTTVFAYHGTRSEKKLKSAKKLKGFKTKKDMEEWVCKQKRTTMSSHVSNIAILNNKCVSNVPCPLPEKR